MFRCCCLIRSIRNFAWIHDFDVSVDNVILGTTGARAGAISFDLPAGHTVHADDGSGHPEARGRREIVLAAVSPSATTDFGLLHASGSPGFLHTSTIPLSFRVQSMELAAASLTGVFDKVAYQYDVAFSTRDPRRAMGIESNDQRMRQPNVAPIPFALSTLGLDTTVNFDAASGRLHFPASATNWQAYSLDIVQGQLMDGDALSSEHYSFHQSATCDGCVADTDGTYFNRSASAAAIGWDGASVAAFATLGANPEWGPYDANGGRNIYRRSGDHTHSAVMQVPGFHAQGTGGSSDTSVVQYLLGMRAAELVSAAVVPGQQHLLASAEARSGNHFMAGISVGPSLYSSGIHNQPVVGTLGSDLTQRGNPADPNVPAS